MTREQQCIIQNLWPKLQWAYTRPIAAWNGGDDDRMCKINGKWLNSFDAVERLIRRKIERKATIK